MIACWFIYLLILIFVINLGAIYSVASPSPVEPQFSALAKVLSWREPSTGKPLNLPINRQASLPHQVIDLYNLQWLNLRNNHLSELPPEIGYLINLQSLNLSDNQLTELPLEFANLINLQGLGLGDNNLTELFPEIGKLVSLKRLF